MNPNDPNVLMLEVVAERLGEALCGQMVFVGGAVAGLLITDAGNPEIRPTEDVDIVVEALALHDYHRVEKELRARGFVQDAGRAGPVCRWRIGAVSVDVMPTLEKILGFSNRWHPLALATAQPMALPSGLAVRVIQAPVFLGTKLEAFHGRGKGDFLFSHDIGDLLAVVDGRDTLVEECRQSAAELRAYLGKRIANLMANSAFVEALQGHLAGDAANQARLPDLDDRLRQLAGLGKP